MRFTKMQGCGNDYIYVNAMEERVESPGRLAKAVSDRHFGIGADGLILIGASKTADFSMEMYNADGSKGAMCGNGIRCVGKYVYEHGLTRKTTLTFEHLSCFPDRINTEFIQILDQHTIKMRVWERGSGETLSCGTGACAAAVAAMLSGCVSEGETAVELRGGRLFVTWDRTKNKVLLTGPAETVFEGTLAERI